MTLVDDKDLLKIRLKEVFGYDSFRGNQEIIINNILDGKDTFVIMPTGAGKSLCYQLPAVYSGRTAIVISPLIALMKNQVDQLNAYGVNAQFLNSTLTKTEMNRVKKETLSGKVKLLYVAPESLTKEENIEFLKKADIAFIAVDEAHCISEWGHDFRPEYRRIRSIIEMIGKNLPLIALTATATPKVQQDIRKNLGIEEATTYLSSFNRKNLYYEIRPKKHTKKQLIKYLLENKGKSGIIYCLSRKKVEEIAELLRVNGIRSAPYHAGLDASVREANQDAFLNEEVEVIVATIAFGMGIDKPDVRFVIHYDVPKSLEGYYQETGRAGRDGLEGNCIMFYSHNDISKLEKFNKDKSVTERENARILLQEMTYFVESPVCRRRLLLHYFGENFKEKNCGACDNCTRPQEKFDAKPFMTLALHTVVATGERFALDHISDVLRGVMSKYVESYDHHTLDYFGKGAQQDEIHWKSVIRQLLVYDFLSKDIENPGILKITQKGQDFLTNPYSFDMSRDHQYELEANEEEEARPVAQPKSYDEVLFEQLKALRKTMAHKMDLPPYVIFQDPSLEEMATTYPTSKSELAQVVGVGQGKVAKFGDEFIKTIKRYVEENDIETASEVVIKSSVNKSKIKIYIIQQVDRKVDLEEICDSKGISFDELLTEIENICYSGTKLNLDYYIDQILDEEKQDDIFDYFMNAESDSLDDAMAELGGDYNDDEIRLMRVKFLSEIAN